MKQESLDVLEEMLINIEENNNYLQILLSYCKNNPNEPTKNIAELLEQIHSKHSQILNESKVFSLDLYKYMLNIN